MSIPPLAIISSARYSGQPSHKSQSVTSCRFCSRTVPFRPAISCRTDGRGINPRYRPRVSAARVRNVARSSSGVRGRGQDHAVARLAIVNGGEFSATSTAALRPPRSSGRHIPSAARSSRSHRATESKWIRAIPIACGGALPVAPRTGRRVVPIAADPAWASSKSSISSQSIFTTMWCPPSGGPSGSPAEAGHYVLHDNGNRLGFPEGPGNVMRFENSGDFMRPQ